MFNFFKKSSPSVAETAVEQNIFDNETFFEGYRKLRGSDTNSNDLLEQPAMRKLLLDVTGKSVLDLIYSSLAFHYVENFDLFAKMMYNYLNVGGQLLFSQERPIITATVDGKRTFQQG